MKLSRLISFILNDTFHKNNLLIALFALTTQLIVFKILYPFPDFISDSYNYIETNLSNLKVNLWPIGYAKFLALIHYLSPSHLFLVVTQFIILETALLYFFFSICYIFPLPKAYIRLLYIFLFFNPLFLYLSNCVLSDAIFCAISLLIFTQYLWMFHQPRWKSIIIQTLLIAIAFTIRYTAIYYPIVSIIAIFLSRFSKPIKLLAIVAPWILIFLFINYTQQKTKEITGTAEFSVFGGWQIANNALYMYEHITIDTTTLPDATKELDKTAKRYFKLIAPRNPPLEAIQGTYFIKVPNAILKPYLSKKIQGKTIKSGFEAWGTVSPIYKQYGTWLIQKHPLSFIKYYIWFNTKLYFIPYLEKFEIYNLGTNQIWKPAQEWFVLPSNIIYSIIPNKIQQYTFNAYPFIFMILNAYFLAICILSLTMKKKFIQNSITTKALITAISFLIINFCFSVFATPIVLRYQIVPMIIIASFSLIGTDFLSILKNKHIYKKTKI